MNIKCHEFGKRTQEKQIKMIKNKNNSYFLERTDERSSWMKTHQSKVNKVLSYMGNLIKHIIVIESVSAETNSCSYRIHDRRIYTLITH